MGTPIVLSESMTPVEPLCSWFRELSLDRRSVKTMRAYAYTTTMLLRFLLARGADLTSATETDLQEFRRWRLDDAEQTISEAAWDRDAAAIGSLYDFLVRRGMIARRPWRATGRGRRSLSTGVSRDLRVRHMGLEQYLFLRDVGFGGLAASAGLDERFRGWRPHRNRAACELALLTGMRIQEWSTVLLPELGLLGDGQARAVEFELGACAKFGRPRRVYVPADAAELLGPYLLLERPEIVAKAQSVLRRRRRELFVVTRLEADGAKVRGLLDGAVVTRSVRGMDPRLRRLAVLETGDGLDPLALFVGTGGRMLTASGWDRVRWAAWDRMRAQAGDGQAGLLPGRCWVFHDLRHTFALRLLIYLTELALQELQRRGASMATLLEHMSGNPLLQVQRRLGHASPATTYRYIRYLKDPMRDVAQAFRAWTVAGGATYAEIARHALDGQADAPQR
ncbi:tyrosine-type recombinase/integrase [Micromonospora aurantiaca (nom. illeg.)]|uniref:Site-specific integrase n=2 Tax=Micromonospora TaxID=1873 RepID=A0ABS3VJS8_MICEH|nr:MULTISPECIES: site-specific integrase [Micromonospora]MBC9005441.1 site-specific integrase [Micromonospora aurantiaca]MBO4204775.1 site-specific integrase [Micromonospora echinofusca]